MLETCSVLPLLKKSGICRQSAGKSVIIGAMDLSQRQTDIIVGTLLGDGSLEHDKFKASRLQIKQAERKKEYVMWLYENLATLVRTPPKQRPDTLQWYFSTRSLISLEEFRNAFYSNGRKTVPHSIKSLLKSPITLAVWFMDDGTLDYREKSHYSFSFSADDFTVEEVELLQQALEDNFGVISNIQTPSSRGKRYTKLYVGKNGRDRFLGIIAPHILSCFAYKLPPNYGLTPQRLILREQGCFQ
ncbi:MAG: hypothetical protein QOG91_249 [Candidatus Parcubacteria bacterium]|nr:hypothetical protein [Candidatus Parcubacteria bacterium]